MTPPKEIRLLVSVSRTALTRRHRLVIWSCFSYNIVRGKIIHRTYLSRRITSPPVMPPRELPLEVHLSLAASLYSLVPPGSRPSSSPSHRIPKTVAANHPRIEESSPPGLGNRLRLSMLSVKARHQKRQQLVRHDSSIMP